MITLSALNTACAAFQWANQIGSNLSSDGRANLLRDVKDWRRNADVTPHLALLQNPEKLQDDDLRKGLTLFALGILRPLKDEMRRLLEKPNTQSIEDMERAVAELIEDRAGRIALSEGAGIFIRGLFQSLASIQEAVVSGALSFDATPPIKATPPTPLVTTNSHPTNIAQTPSVNTVPRDQEVGFPGGSEALALTQKLTNILRWNVYAIVAGAQHNFPGIGGHISTFASNADFLTVLLLQFVHRNGVDSRNDHLWLQGHDAPGIYALLFVLGLISEEQLLRFRREAGYENQDGSITIDEGMGKGTSSYPHPMAMHELWENPSVVMGAAGYHPIEKLISDKHMQDHGLLPPHINGHKNRAWVVLGDASMCEPEIQGGNLHKAGELKLKVRHLVNLNLQGLDGIVDGNGNGSLRRTIRGRYQAAGWKVVEVILDSQWDQLLEKDTQGLIAQRLEELNDGSLFNLQGQPPEYFRKNFFGKKGTGPFDQQEDNPELLALLDEIGFTDTHIASLGWGGHDLIKIYNAYIEADKTDGPAIILFRTVKGKGMSKAEAAITTHGFKGKPDKQAFHEGIARSLGVDLSSEKLRNSSTPLFPFITDRDVKSYAAKQRESLGGQVPRRHVVETPPLIFDPKTIQQITDSLIGGRATDMSTTMAAVKLMSLAMADPSLGRFIAPIFADEADTFGANALLATHGYYHPSDPQFTFDPSKTYKQGPKGRAIQVGINEAAAIAAFTAFGTAYATQGVPMLPILMCYSKFLFPHVGNWIWSAGDALARGFLFGATAGKTTLNGEGREHEDGETPLIALTHPHVHTFDLATPYEVAAVFLEGLNRFYGDGQRFNEIFNLMLYNEKFPSIARSETATNAAILKGLYLLAKADESAARNAEAHIIASGPMLHQAMASREELENDFGIGINVWSGTNIPNLWRDGEAVRRHNRDNPGDRRTPYLHQLFRHLSGTVIGASDYHPATMGLLSGLFPDSIEYTPLGGFGFGPSDTRKVLRRLQGVDRQTMTLEVLQSFSRRGQGGITTTHADDYARKHGFDKMPPRRDLVVL